MGAPQVRSLRPSGDFDSAAYVPELALRLSSLGHLEELGPVCIDTDCGEVMLPPSESLDPSWPAAGDKSSLKIKELVTPSGRTFELVSVKNLLPMLSSGFSRCRVLAELDLTIRCMRKKCAQAVSEQLLPALGRCHALRALRLDLDASLECGAILIGGVANLLESLASTAAGALEHLSLGYLWWSEASEESLARIRTALMALCNHRGGGLRELVIRYPQDQEMGAMENLCAAIEGVASDIEEVCLVEAWGEDCASKELLLKALAGCQRLRRVDILGFLPQALNQAAFSAILRRDWVGTDRQNAPEVFFNTPAGWRRAAKSAPSVSDRQRLLAPAEAPACLDDGGPNAEDQT